eukprot:g19042.t1
MMMFALITRRITLSEKVFLAGDGLETTVSGSDLRYSSERLRPPGYALRENHPSKQASCVNYIEGVRGRLGFVRRTGEWLSVKAVQDEEQPTCGNLGDCMFGVRANRWTWGEAEQGWRELAALQPDPAEQNKRSMELGMPSPTRISSAFSRMRWEHKRWPLSFLSLLNGAGREAISSVVRQRSTLYPPATAQLEDIRSDYSSLKGSEKWLLGSILLLVARCVLHDTTSLGRYIKKRELVALNGTAIERLVAAVKAVAGDLGGLGSHVCRSLALLQGGRAQEAYEARQGYGRSSQAACPTRAWEKLRTR